MYELPDALDPDRSLLKGEDVGSSSHSHGKGLAEAAGQPSPELPTLTSEPPKQAMLRDFDLAKSRKRIAASWTVLEAQTALEMWKVILCSGLQHTKLGRALVGISGQPGCNKAILQSLTDAFRLKSTSTLRTKAKAARFLDAVDLQG